MEQAYIADKTFDRQNYTERSPEKGTYDSCSFRNCDFSKADLSEFTFIDCVFQECNLSQVKLINTLLRDVQFNECKMLGMGFDKSNPLGLTLSFDNCILNFSSFFRTKLKQTRFNNCQLQDTDFTEGDLSGSFFENCDFSRAMFDHTNLEKTDFRTAFNYTIDPESNKIKKAKFSWPSATGLLSKYNIEIG